MLYVEQAVHTRACGDRELISRPVGIASSRGERFICIMAAHGIYARGAASPSVCSGKGKAERGGGVGPEVRVLAGCQSRFLRNACDPNRICRPPSLCSYIWPFREGCLLFG